MCVERRIERVEAFIAFNRIDIGLGFFPLPQLTPEELDLDTVKAGWQQSFSMDPDVYDSLEFSETADGRLAARCALLKYRVSPQKKRSSAP